MPGALGPKVGQPVELALLPDSGRITRDSERAALRVNIGSREHLTGSHRPGDFSVVHLLHAAEPSGSACREDDQFPSSA
jgi:hypothetical protein